MYYVLLKLYSLLTLLLFELNARKILALLQPFRYSHALAICCIAIGGAQQPTALIRQTVVMVPPFAVQTDQICNVPFLHITFPVSS
jgi:hypothetical protein